MKLITFSGIDGSGKTSQLKLTKKYLRGRGDRVFHFHMINFSIANKILVKGKRKAEKNKQSKQPKAKTSAGFLGILLRKTALIIDIFRFRFLFRKLKFQNKYDYLITDRYFYDQIINILFLKKETFLDRSRVWQKIAEKFIIKPDFAFYVKVKVKTALQRDREIEQGRSYLRSKKRLYEKAVSYWDFDLVNGELDSAEKVFKEIKDRLTATT